MHRHDLNLIAAYADGSLEDETQARARVESCPVCRSEYESQLLVLSAFGDAESASMTETEKAALHRDVWTALRVEDQVATLAAPWWYRWSYAAAGLFLVVGLVAVISQVGGEDNTTEVFEEAAGVTEESADIEPAPASADDVATDLQAAPAAPVDQEFAAGADSGSDAAIADETEAAAEALPFDLFAKLQSLRETTRAVSVTDPSVHEDCLSEAGLENHHVVELYSVEEGEFIAARAEDAPDDADYTFVDLATCEVVPSGE